MREEERAKYADDLRQRRLAKNLLLAMGIDLVWVTLDEQIRVDRLVDEVVSVIRQIERVGFVRGYADAVATYEDYVDRPTLPPVDIWEGLGCPRG